MLAKARDESDAAFDAYFYWLCDGSMSFGNMAGGGGGGGGGGHTYHYGTMGSGYYDSGHPTYNTSDVMGSLWNATPVDNKFHTYSNIGGDWYHTSRSFITVILGDVSDQNLTASLLGVGSGPGDPPSDAQQQKQATREYIRSQIENNKNLTWEDKFGLRLQLLGGSDIDFWVQQNGGKILSPLTLFNPLVSLPNDFYTLFKGVDLFGYPATTFNRVVSGADILTFGAASGVFRGVSTWASWGNYGTTGYSVVGTYINNYSRKK